MTKQEIFKKAIEQAYKKGFSNSEWMKEIIDNANYIDWVDDGKCYGTIFSHDFAKAFWGDYPLSYVECAGPGIEQRNWEYHLQQMVLEEEPIRYLEKFIGDN